MGMGEDDLQEARRKFQVKFFDKIIRRFVFRIENSPKFTHILDNGTIQLRIHYFDFLISHTAKILENSRGDDLSNFFARISIEIMSDLI